MFHELIKKLKCLDDIDQIFKSQEDCLEFLEDLMWAGYPESPFDCTSKVYKPVGWAYLPNNNI